MSLFSQEELQSMYDRAQAKAGFVYQNRTPEQWESRAVQRTRAEKCESDRRVLVEIARDFPDSTIAELAEASARSKTWVRRTLKAAGIVLAEPVHRKKAGCSHDHNEPDFHSPKSRVAGCENFATVRVAQTGGGS
jgi:hypothetical protein